MCVRPVQAHRSIGRTPLPPDTGTGKALNGISYRQLVLPQVLQEIGKNLLSQFCGHFQSDFVGHNLKLPELDLPDADYFNALAALLKSPSLLPERFKDALFDIEELA